MWIQLYDPARVPPHWLEIIAPEVYCVFILDAEVRAPRDRDGMPFADGQASTEVSDTLTDAIAFAAEVVNRHPELCCEIYTAEGKSGEPIQTVYHPAVKGRYEGMPLAKRELRVGLALVALAVPFIVYDFRHDLRWLWGYIIGLKLLIVGVTYLIRGTAEWARSRAGVNPAG